MMLGRYIRIILELRRNIRLAEILGSGGIIRA